MQKIYTSLMLVCVGIPLFGMEPFELGDEKGRTIFKLLTNTIDINVEMLYQLGQKLRNGELTLEQAREYKVDDVNVTNNIPLLYVKAIQARDRGDIEGTNVMLKEIDTCFENKKKKSWLITDDEHNALASYISNGSILMQQLFSEKYK